MTAGGHGFDGVERRGLMFVLSSPSGAGKTTLSRLLIDRMPGLKMSVSATTRPMRPGEVDGRDYLFVDKSRFEQMAKRRTSCWNGPPCSTIATARRARRSKPRCRPDRTCCSTSTGRAPSNCGRRRGADVVSVFILPPSAADLEKRLHYPRAGFRRGDPRPDEPRQPRD